MKRRSFLKASMLTTSATTIMSSFANATTANDQKQEREFYELREYLLKDETQQKIVENYFQNAVIPAYNRLGSKPIGVFSELKPEGQTRLFAVIPYKSLDDFSTVHNKLASDSKYQHDASDYLNAPATTPAYERMNVSLLKAFKGMPQIKVPGSQQRIFELRRYESPTESAAKKKIEMFNDAGEMAIFNKAGLRAVFFGEMLIGSMMPNLTYMLTYNDMEEHDKNWKQFGSDPEWKKLSTTPEYTDARLISKITATFLTPASFSQI